MHPSPPTPEAAMRQQGTIETDAARHAITGRDGRASIIPRQEKG